MARALLHLVKYKLGWETAQTQTTAAEREAIKAHAATRLRAVEIGVFEGVTTGVIAASLAPEAVLYGIDPFIPGRMGVCWGKAIAKSEAYRLNPECSIEFIEEFSHAASEKINGTFDFVFIDGDHSREGFTQDWADWSPRVDVNGIIALHDTVVPDHNPRVATLGSRKYFDEHIQHDDRFQIIQQIDSLSVLQRRS